MSSKSCITLLYCAFLVVARAVDVAVVNTNDGPPYATMCVNSSALCNFRSAWEYCLLIKTECVITLPAESSIIINATFGSLQLLPSASIEVKGNGATIFGVGHSPPPPLAINDSPDFPLITGTLEDTLFATRNTAEACAVGCPGEVLKFSACDHDANGDTYFRLYLNDTEIIENDDYCGLVSQITYEVPSHAECEMFCLRVGCYDLYSCSANVTLTHVTIDTNTSDFRFVTYNNDTNATSAPILRLSNLTIRDFHGAQHGGVMSTTGAATITLSDITFVNNSALFSGGAIYIEDNVNSGIVIADCVFSDVVVSGYENVGESGGAIYIANRVANTQIMNCSFIRCFAHDAAGGAIAIGTENFGIILQSLVFMNCTSDSGGGAMYIASSNRDISITQSTFINCYAAINGGGLVIDTLNTNIFVTSSEFIRCASSQLDGGGVLINVDNSNITLSGCLFEACSTFRAGGGVSLFSSNTDVTVEDCRFEECESAFTGGSVSAIFSNDNFILQNSYIINSYAGFAGGGATMYQANNNATLRNIQFVNNSAGSDGGGVFIRNSMQSLHMENCNFSMARAGSRGGAIYFSTANSHARLNVINVFDSRAASEGGALYVGTGNVDMQVTNSAFSNATAGSGGAIYVSSRNDFFTVDGCKIVGCVAQNYVGGGVAITEDNTDVRILRSLFSHSAAFGEGGALYSSSMNHRLVVAGCEMFNNEASSGGAIYIGEDHDNTIISDYASWSQLHIIESEHPYEAQRGTNVFASLVNVSDTGEYIVIFDRLTEIGSEEILYIFDSQAKNEIYFIGDKNNLWPGINLVVLRVPGPLIYIEFQGPPLSSIFAPTTYDMNLYGVKMYVIPVLERAMKVAITGNVALDNGGAIHVGYSCNFPVILQLNLTENSAENGGGMYVRNAVAGLVMQDVDVIRNIAEVNGGGLMLSTSNYGMSLKDCLLQSNAAGESGGAVYMKADNGYGRFQSDNEVFFDQVDFSFNVANYGGAIGVESTNTLAFQNCTLRSNAAESDGGAIYIAMQNTLIFRTTKVLANVARRSGGAVIAVDGNTLYITDTNFTSNIAQRSVGGGIVANSMKHINVCGWGVFSFNAAAKVGGGLALSSSPMWHVCEGGHLQFISNRSPRGSAVFLHDIDLHSADEDAYALRDVDFIQNNASVGGTVFWLYSDTMHHYPSGLLTSSMISWQSNYASYGVTTATQAVHIFGPEEYIVSVYGQPLSPALVYYLADYHNHSIPLTGFTSLYASIDSTDCNGRYAYLSGHDMFGAGVSMDNGSAVFNSLEAYCYPGGSMLLQIEARLGDLSDISASTAEVYYISVTTRLIFRDCYNGEFLKDGQCLVCPAGSYSLAYEAAGHCTDCSDTQGVEDCAANHIYLKEGYWRRYPQNAAVLACPMGSSSCGGGSSTGDDACREGYEGPLCSVCSKGYYPSQNTCHACQGPSIISPLMMMYVIVVIFIIALFAIIAYVKLRHKECLADDAPLSNSGEVVESKLESFYEWVKLNHGKITVKAKILIATYQIVVSTSNILDVDFTSGFTKFINIFDFINLSISNAFPLSCSQTFTFIDSLVLTTLLPLGLAAALWICFVAEYLNVRRKIQANEHRQRGEKRRAFNALKDKYLTFFFYLTYIVLPSVTTTIFQMFVCTNIDPDDEDDSSSDWYLSADMRISCASSYYYGGVIYAVVMILLYPVGVVTLYFKLLHLHRSEIATRMQSEKLPLSPHVTRIGFLWEAYQPQYWYWEIVETARRLLLTAVLSVCDPGSTEQSVFSIILSLIYVKLYGHYKPYSQVSDNTMAEFGAYQIFVTFYVGQVIINKMLSSQLDILLDIVLIISNCSMLLLICYFGWRQHQKSKKSEVENCVMSQQWEEGIELSTMSNPIGTGQSKNSSKTNDAV